MFKSALTALATSVLAACSLAVPADFVVPLAHNEWGDYKLLVFDESGLVAGVRGVDQKPGQFDQVVARPELREVEIGWTGGACSHEPTLKVTGTPDVLRLDVANADDPPPLPFLPIRCPAVGVPLRVLLSLIEPVRQDAVSIEVKF